MSVTATTAIPATSPDSDAGPALSIRQLKKVFHRPGGQDVPAIDDTTMDVAKGELLVLLGASGCGKSTFLRCIAGLETPDSGVIESHGRIWYSSQDRMLVPPERRDLSMIFQSYALWPHMTIRDNVAYPLTVGKKRPSRTEIRERVDDVLRMMGIENLAEQYPAQISGGQQQRVALARALVRGSEIVLFDEPLSNVDARVRDQLRTEIRAMQQRLGFTAIYVTHDQEEALAIADRIAVIDHGVVAHLGTPREVYLAPANLRVARFVGKLNEVDGVVSSVEGGRVTVRTDIGEVVAGSAQEGLAVGDPAVAVWRPDRVRLGGGTSGPNSWDGVVTSSHFFGSFTDTKVAVAGVTVLTWDLGDCPQPIQGSVRFSVAPDDVRALKPMP
ncbi:ABC transporter ATP-binding protein [Microbispora sp. H10836]|uniref:ABC transporter ATP-binding protein n=1 Tax=Microbispora sp. H10836 TaxID=2729106 RepID=UPI001475DD8F|nr:ABC transporter ATP-binding protein [Microbispora sp. H10836]